VGATINIAASLHAVADDLAAAVLALWRERVNGAFKAIKVTRNAIVDYFQRLIVFISTNFTLHNISPLWIVLRIPGRA
jgi:hypothetical protein